MSWFESKMAVPKDGEYIYTPAEFVHHGENLPQEGDCVRGSCFGDEPGNLYGVIRVIWW